MSYQHICYTNPKFHKAGHSYITLTFPKQLNAVQILHYIHLDKALKSPNLPKILVPPPSNIMKAKFIQPRKSAFLINRHPRVKFSS